MTFIGSGEAVTEESCDLLPDRSYVRSGGSSWTCGITNLPLIYSYLIHRIGFHISLIHFYDSLPFLSRKTGILVDALSSSVERPPRGYVQITHILTCF